MRCLNCENLVGAQARFCAECGQRTDSTRLTMPDIVRELMHSFVNVERSVVVFFLALLTRPGRVAREYVDGRRRRHFGPFATLATVVGLTALAVNLSGFDMLAQDGFSNESANFFEQHFNWLLLMQLPLLGGIGAVVFRGARLTVPEHMVLAAYLLSMRGIFLALVLPLSYLTSASAPTLIQVTAYWLAWYSYYGWGASQFYEGPRHVAFAKGMATAALAHGTIALFIRAFAGLIGTALHLLSRP